jgi:hypothetical protein
MFFVSQMMQISVSFGSKFHESNFFQVLLEQATKLEEPKIVRRHFAIDFQHARLHHRQLSDRYLRTGAEQVLDRCFRQL